MTKYTTKLMTPIEAINYQTKYDHIFGHVIKYHKLSTSDREIKSGHLYADFGHFFVTYLSFCTSDPSLIFPCLPPIYPFLVNDPLKSQ